MFRINSRHFQRTCLFLFICQSVITFAQQRKNVFAEISVGRSVFYHVNNDVPEVNGETINTTVVQPNFGIGFNWQTKFGFIMQHSVNIQNTQTGYISTNNNLDYKVLRTTNNSYVVVSPFGLHRNWQGFMFGANIELPILLKRKTTFFSGNRQWPISSVGEERFSFLESISEAPIWLNFSVEKSISEKWSLIGQCQLSRNSFRKNGDVYCLAGLQFDLWAKE